MSVPNGERRVEVHGLLRHIRRIKVMLVGIDGILEMMLTYRVGRHFRR